MDIGNQVLCMSTYGYMDISVTYVTNVGNINDISYIWG